MRSTMAAAIAIAALVAPQCFAEEPSPWAETSRKVSEAHQKNAEQLRQHVWKRRVEVEKEGGAKREEVRQMRYDPAGRLRATTTGDEEHLVKDRQAIHEAMGKQHQRDKAEQIARVVAQYSYAPAEKLDGFLATGAFTKGSGKAKDTVQIKGTDFARKGDTVTLSVDAETGRLRRIEFHTGLGGEPLEGVVEYKILESGLDVPAHADVKLPSRKMSAVVETFDYEARK